MPRGDGTGPWWAQSSDLPGFGKCRGFGARGMMRGTRRGRGLGHGARTPSTSIESSDVPRSLSIEERLARLEARFEGMNAGNDDREAPSEASPSPDIPEQEPTSHE